MTGQNRINDALQLALSANEPDSDNRYLRAMMERAETILKRSAKVRDPETELAGDAKSLAEDIRNRKSTHDLEPILRQFVEAKLAISNPEYFTDQSSP